jgi:predicted nucleic acid-binding protein
MIGRGSMMRVMVMSNKAHDLNSYQFSKGEGILIDANIWLYLFPAPVSSAYKFAYQYSNGFQRLLQAGAEPILDHMVLSEYLNRYCRIEWEVNFKVQYPKFKQFRMSVDFGPVSTAAHTFASKILSFCKTHSISVSKVELEKALSDFKSGGIDFNDAIISEVCRQNNIKLMTNDADFQCNGIEILTTNNRLLNAYS